MSVEEKGCGGHGFFPPLWTEIRTNGDSIRNQAIRNAMCYIVLK